MPPLSLEDRVAVLEREFAQFKSQPNHVRVKDWRRTIGIFTDNTDMKELFAEAMKLRAADRRKSSGSKTRRHHANRSAKP